VIICIIFISASHLARVIYQSWAASSLLITVILVPHTSLCVASDSVY